MKPNFKHGYYLTPEYRIWIQIKQRTRNRSCKAFVYYGARGIKICDKWFDSFQEFINDVGFRPSQKHQIERIDNNGNYEPGNVRWATRKEQMHNTRQNRLVTLEGITKPIAIWADELGLNRNTVNVRIYRGWSNEEALFTPLSLSHRRI